MSELMSTAAAAEELGISESQFRYIVNKFSISPDDYYPNPHYKSGPEAQLWSRRKIGNLKRRKAVKEARARRGGRAPKDYESAFRQKYASPRAALVDACEALFNLNRYTRHDECSDTNRKEIYNLKSALIKKLYFAEIFTDRVERLTKSLPGKVCFACGGSDYPDEADIEDDSLDDYPGNGCRRCGGTGWYRAPKEVCSYVFTFSVDGRRFTWMQPDFALDFTPRVEESKPDEGPRTLDDELTMPKRKLPEAKALIRFVLDGWGDAASNGGLA